VVGTVIMKGICGNNLPDQYLPRNQQTKREVGEEARIRKDLLAHTAIDLQRSANRTAHVEG